MLPLRDDIPASRFPLATVALIVLNVLAFLWELEHGAGLGRVIDSYGVVPQRYADARVAGYFTWFELAVPFFSSMFLHGGWVHLLGNMWVLWIFGDNVEDRLGRLRYIGLYVAAGLAASGVHIYTNAHSAVPTIGASGAVAGVMGAYFRFFPHARVETMIPPLIFGPYFVLPAVIFLGWWFLLQFFHGTAAIMAGPGRDFSGIAWWAHAGGFVFGLIVCLFARRRHVRHYAWGYDEDWE